MNTDFTNMRPFPLSDVTPEGWQGGNLRMRGEGLLGNLDKIAVEIKESKWLGFTAGDYDSLPLWLMGFIPTAWLLSDLEMQERASLYVKKILDTNKDGWIPKKSGKNEFELNSLFVMLDALCLYADVTGNGDIDDYILSALYEIDEYTDKNPLTKKASLTWASALKPILREIERTNDTRLVRLGKKLSCMGFDWIKFFDGWDYAGVSADDMPGAFFNDVRNCVCAVKSCAMLGKFYGDLEYVNIAEQIIKLLEHNHGSLLDMFTGDFLLGGKSTEHGISLSALCDYMSALSELLALSGDVHFADRLERLAYNAYMGAFSSDMWTYRQVQTVNQINADKILSKQFTTAGSDSAVFGITSAKDGCVSDFCKGYASFLTSQFLKSDDGISINGFSPALLQTVINATPVEIRITGDYPFRNTASISVTAATPVTFTLAVRIPSWTENMRVSTGSDMTMPRKGEYYLLNGTWTDTTTITIDTNDKFRLKRLSNELYSVYRGPLLFAMPLNSEKTYTDGNAYPYSAYELSASQDWNYAICVEDKDRFYKEITFEEKPVTSVPFSCATPPVEMFVYGNKIQWPARGGHPIYNPFAVATSPKKEMLRFIPFGATDLRMSALPTIR